MNKNPMAEVLNLLKHDIAPVTDKARGDRTFLLANKIMEFIIDMRVAPHDEINSMVIALVMLVREHEQNIDGILLLIKKNHEDYGKSHNDHHS